MDSILAQEQVPEQVILPRAKVEAFFARLRERWARERG